MAAKGSLLHVDGTVGPNGGSSGRDANVISIISAWRRFCALGRGDGGSCGRRGGEVGGAAAAAQVRSSWLLGPLAGWVARPVEKCDTEEEGGKTASGA